MWRDKLTTEDSAIETLHLFFCRPWRQSMLRRSLSEPPESFWPEF